VAGNSILGYVMHMCARMHIGTTEQHGGLSSLVPQTEHDWGERTDNGEGGRRRNGRLRQKLGQFRGFKRGSANNRVG